LLLLLACEDPVKQAAIAQLGPEAPGIEPGPLHRPGQPCVLCHDGSDPAVSRLAYGGTLVAEAKTEMPLSGVDVILSDARGRRGRATSNCAGNFFLRPGEVDLQFPVWISLAAGTDTIAMESPIFREASCATCHRGTLGPRSAGPIFLFPDPRPIPPGLSCR
jgi:hypothetical protein